MTQEELQRLFNRYNRKYWLAQLPRYSVVVSTRWRGGYCAKRLRAIFIHPDIAADDRQAKRTLLHEMSHAAAPSGHGKLWIAEMRRIKKLGAPIPEKEITAYESYEDVPTRKSQLQDFYDAGMELPETTWATIKIHVGYRNGLVDDHGRAEDRGVARFLEKCRREFLRGRREAREMRESRRRWEQGGANHGQPRQARSREEKAKETATQTDQQASKTRARIQTCRATATVIANRRRDGRVS